MYQTHRIPQELKNVRQWMPHRKKAPIDTHTHKKAKWKNPETWRSFDEAVRYAEQNGCDGVGFVVTEDDPYTFFDIDNCRNKSTGELGFGVQEIIDELGSYAEASPSGKGVHGVVRATKPGDRVSTNYTQWGGKLEIFDRNHFVTVTGNVIQDAPIRDAQDAVDDLYRDYFGEDESKDGEGVNTPSDGFSEDEIWTRLHLARNHPETGALFRKLFDHGNCEGYPSRSEADLALCGMLAYWFGCDAETIRELFRSSALARGKYAEKGRHAEKYLDKMVSKAVASCTKTYSPEHGDEMKARASEIVAGYEDSLHGWGLSKKERAILGYMLHIAGSVGHYANGAPSERNR